MNEKKTGSMRRKGTISDTIVHVLLAVLAVIWVIPILWIVLLSFSSQKGSYVTTFFPKGYTLHNLSLIHISCEFHLSLHENHSGWRK